jgi:GxxExxY protein
VRGIKFLRQQLVPIPYKDIKLGIDLRLYLLVEEKVIVDLKAKKIVTAIDHQKSDHIYG